MRMRQAITGFAAALCLLGLQNTGRCEDPPRSPPQGQGNQWVDPGYVGQLIVGDLAALGVIFLGAKAQSLPLVGVGVGLSVVGAPGIHIANGHPERGGLSFATRLLIPTAGLAAGIWFGNFEDKGKDKVWIPSSAIYGALGYVIGWVITIPLDYGQAGPRVRQGSVAAKPALLVQAIPMEGGGLAGLAGTF